LPHPAYAAHFNAYFFLQILYIFAHILHQNEAHTAKKHPVKSGIATTRKTR